MSKLDDALREALRRESPPEGFAERVMAKVEVCRARVGLWGAEVDLAGLDAHVLDAWTLNWHDA